MSKTACWGTGKLVECAWVGFGYGSCYDTAEFWISLEAAKALARLDFSGPSTNGWDGTDEELAALPPKFRMMESAWHVHIPGNPEKSIEWWIEIEKEMGMDKHDYVRNDREYRQVIAKMFPEDWKIKTTCYEKYHIAHECHYGYTNRFFPTKGIVVVGLIDALLSGTYGQEEREQLEYNPHACTDADLRAIGEDVVQEPSVARVKSAEEIEWEDYNAKYGPEIIPSQSHFEDYNTDAKDDNCVCVRYAKDHSGSHIHFPKDFLVMGGRVHSNKMDNQYHEVYGYVSPPEDWYKFGGYLRVRRMDGTGGSRNPRTYPPDADDGQKRNCKSPSEEWFIFGGPLPEYMPGAYNLHCDYHRNPKIP